MGSVNFAVSYEKRQHVYSKIFAGWIFQYTKTHFKGHKPLLLKGCCIVLALYKVGSWDE